LALHPTRDAIRLAPAAPAVIAEDLTGPLAATDWFATTFPVLLALVREAGRRRLDTHAWQLAWTLVNFLDRQGYWDDLAAVERAALQAAGRLGDREAQARWHEHVGLSCARRQRFDSARTHLESARRLRDSDDLVGRGNIQRSLAWVYAQEDRHQQALDAAGQALELFEAAGHQAGQADTLNAIGWAHAGLGDYAAAIAHCEKALALLQQMGSHATEAATWDTIGYANHHLGCHLKAVDCYRHSVTLYRQIGDRQGEAEPLMHLGDTYHAAGDTDAARDAWKSALSILDELDHPDAEHVRARLGRLDKTSA
jgi:tetratricopeptide (TPR) repeat protein